MNNLSDYVGAFGVGLLLLAYLFTILKILEPKNRSYIWMNVIGAVFACLASVMIHYLPFIVLEGAWALVSMATLLKSFRKIVS